MRAIERDRENSTSVMIVWLHYIVHAFDNE